MTDLFTFLLKDAKQVARCEVDYLFVLLLSTQVWLSALAWDRVADCCLLPIF